MSINAMANAALGRRNDFEPFNAVPRGLHGIVQVAAAVPAAAAPSVIDLAVPAAVTPTPPAVTPAPPLASPTPPQGGPTPPPGGPPNLPDQAKAALQVLAVYIPTEVITLYLGVVGIIKHPEHGAASEWRAFYTFLFFTPVVVFLVYAGKLKSTGKPIFWKISGWPSWEMIAGSLAFIAWAFGLPQSPFRAYEDWYSPAWAGFVPIVASVVIALLAPLFQKPIQP